MIRNSEKEIAQSGGRANNGPWKNDLLSFGDFFSPDVRIGAIVERFTNDVPSRRMSLLPLRTFSASAPHVLRTQNVLLSL